MPPSRRYLWSILLVLALLFGLRRSWSSPPSDFAGYYYGGLALIHGDYARAYDMTMLNDRIAADGYQDAFVSYAPFPPFTSLVFAPFMVFPMDVAKLVFNICSIGLFLFSLMRLTRFLSTPPWVVLALPIIFFIPLLNNVAFGQSYLLLFTLLTEGWLASRKQRRVLSAGLWATAILFKLFPAFLFVFLLLRKRYRDALYLGIGCALLLLISLLINGIAAWKLYVFTIMPRMNHGELNDSFTYIFQSAFMLLKKAFCYDQLLNPHPFADNPWLLTIGLAIFKSALLTTAILLTRRGKDDFFPFAVWIAAAILISPNGSSYSLVLLILPLLGLAWRSRPVIPAAIILAAACAIPVARFGTFPLLAQFPRLYLLLLFYLLLFRPLRRSWNATLFAALAAVFFALDIRGNLPPKDPSSYLLTKEEHLFIDGFTTQDNRLVYSWRDDKGRHEQPTDCPVYSLTEDGLTLKDNQIWYKGRQLTHSPDKKAKPALVNGEYIIFLSDKNRGYEFYTLRKISPDGGPPGGQATPGSSR